MQVLYIIIQIENRVGDQLPRSMVRDLHIETTIHLHFSASFDLEKRMLLVIPIKQYIRFISTSSESVSTLHKSKSSYTGGC